MTRSARRSRTTSKQRGVHTSALPAAGFLLPALAIYGLFFLVPLFGTLALAFTNWSGARFSDIEYVGLANFRALASDSVFWSAVVHNLFFLAGGIAIKTVGALAIALMLAQHLPLSKLFRGIYIIPTILSLVVVGLVFRLALEPTLGFVNPALRVVGLGSFAGEWLSDTHRVIPVLILIDAWQGFGVYMFLFIARLALIPPELGEAARVDGASTLREIWYVTLPELRATFALVVVIAMIDSLRVFDLVFVMTGGGPAHASEVVSSWAFFNAFTLQDVGYGSSMLATMLVVTLVLAYFVLRSLRPKAQH